MASDELDRVRRERDLYRRLLELGDIAQPEKLLTEALAVAVAETSAKQGYLAVFGVDHRQGDPPRWATAHGCSETDRDQLQRRFSSTIIDDTLVTRQVTMVPSAIGSPRYEKKDSVRANAITSVVCAPIGGSSTGILYLQGKATGGVFTDRDEAFVVGLGRHLGRWIDSLLLRDAGGDGLDPTRPYRRGDRFQALIGRSPVLAAVFDAAHAAIRTPKPTLILGPSGAGKATLARELHRIGPRSAGPLQVLDASLLSPHDALAQLAGSEEADDPGLIAAADRGTLLVRCVDALPLAAQRLLTRLVDAGRDPHDRLADVRLIATTSADLTRAVANHGFDRELHLLLRGGNVITMPRLEDRPEDVPLLLDALGRAAAARHGVAWPGVDDSAVRYATETRWPNQIADLEAVLRRAVDQTEGRRPLRDLDLVLPEPAPVVAEGGPVHLVRPGEPIVSLREATFHFRRDYVEQVRELHDRDVTLTAKALDVSRSRYFALLHELGLRDREDR